MADETKPAPAPAPASGGKQKNVGMAILCYLGILVVVPFLTDAKDDPFVKFHIKQGLVLLIAWVIANVIMVVPVIGWTVGGIVDLVLFIFMIMGIVNAAGSKETPLPLIGHLGEKINI